jgi:hypothetical protein
MESLQPWNKPLRGFKMALSSTLCGLETWDIFEVLAQASYESAIMVV